MIEAIMITMKIMSCLGIVLGILSLVNIITGTLVNIWEKNENFNFEKMIKGIIKVFIFYISASAIAVAFTMLPFINEMITNAFGMILLSNDLLNTFSSVGVLGIVCSSIVVQGKKAIQGITKLSNITSETEEITWQVEEPKEEDYIK